MFDPPFDQCPFCERVWLYLLESGVEHEQAFVDISPGNKPDWYKEAIPTGQTPSMSLGGASQNLRLARTSTLALRHSCGGD